MSAPTRESVLREYGTTPCAKGDGCIHLLCAPERKMADEIVRLRTEYADKALAFDLDQAGVESRERDAVELVELRAELQRLRTLADDDKAVGRAIHALAHSDYDDIWLHLSEECDTVAMAMRAALRAALGGAP